LKKTKISLEDVAARIAALERQLDYERQVYQTLLDYTAKQNGAHAVRVKRPYHRRNQIPPSATVPRLRLRSGKPGIGQAVLDLIRDHEGIAKRDAIAKLIEKGISDKPNPKKVFQTRIGQFLDRRNGPILRAEGPDERLYLVNKIL
jgi:hypothetical protein